eukprot:g68476.t1
MEYYPLKWRNVYLRRDGGGGAAEAVDSLLQLVSGLAHLHLASYLHRDIKPDNLVLSQDRRRLCLVDYGHLDVHEPPCARGRGLAPGEVLAGERLPWAGPRQHRKHSKNQYVLRSKQKWQKELTGPLADYLGACRRWSQKPWTEQADYDELCRLVRQWPAAGSAPGRRDAKASCRRREGRPEPWIRSELTGQRARERKTRSKSSAMLTALVWALLAAPARSACALENGTVLNWKARILLADSGLGSYGRLPAITLTIETPASFTGV